AYTLATAQVLGLPPGSYELQMLYGMAEPIKDALVSLEQRVRVYTPYGQVLPGMAYLGRRLLENTANEAFLRASFIEHVPEEQLLMNPQKKSVVRSPWSVAKNNGVHTADRFENEPLTDFSRESARQAMGRALEEVRTQFGRTYPPVVNGQAIPTDSTV